MQLDILNLYLSRHKHFTKFSENVWCTFLTHLGSEQCDQKKSPNVQMTPLQKLPKNVEDLDKLIVAKGFK